MKNTLHKLIEVLRTNHIDSNDFEPKDESVWDSLAFMLGKTTNAIAFNLGDASESLGFSDAVIPENQKLPFPVSWFEFETEAVISQENPTPSGERIEFAFLCCDDHVNPEMYNILPGDYIYQFIFFIKKNGLWAVSDCGHADNKKHIAPVIGKDGTRRGLGALSRSLAAMACTNVCMIENKPSNLVKNRNKKKKLPFFSTWTLHIKGKSKGLGHHGKNKNGTPPRVHFRRGHVREYKPGFYTWVQPCVVGDPKRGMIVKDYSTSTESHLVH